MVRAQQRRSLRSEQLSAAADNVLRALGQVVLYQLGQAGKLRETLLPLQATHSYVISDARAFEKVRSTTYPHRTIRVAYQCHKGLLG